MEQAPIVFASIGIDIAEAQKTHTVGIFQRIEGRRKILNFAYIELDGALVFVAAIHQKLLFLPLGLKCGYGQLPVEHDGDDGGENQHHQQRGPTLRRATAVRDHCVVTASGMSCKSIPCFNWMSSTRAVLGERATIRKRDLRTSPSVAIRMLSPSIK